MTEAGEYIRGAGGVLNRRVAVRGVVGFCLVLLSTMTVVLATQAIRERSRELRLRDHGVAVEVTVTGCVAIASGTGITESGFNCRGSFVLNGRTDAAVIGGTQALYPVGAVVQAVADPNDPTNLSTATAVNARHASSTAFIPAAITFLLLIVLIAGVGWRTRRSKRRPPST
jgi:hypothetical protein